MATTKNPDAAKKLADWAVTEEANKLYAENYAIVALPGIAAKLEYVPGDIEAMLIKNDFAWAAENRERILAEWTKRYDAQVRAQELTLTATGCAKPSRRIRPGRAPSSVRRTCDGHAHATSGRALSAGPRRHQALRAVHRARKCRPRHRARRVRLVPRALRLRQDHAAARDLRARRADDRHDPPGRARHLAACRSAERDFGIVFQSYALFPNLKISDNVGYGLVSVGRTRARDRQRASPSC